jgi:hypothetical protein
MLKAFVKPGSLIKLIGVVVVNSGSRLAPGDDLFRVSVLEPAIRVRHLHTVQGVDDLFSSGELVWWRLYARGYEGYGQD